MKKMLILLVVMLSATTASAIIDPDPDIMGFFFDLEADNPCVEGIAPYAQIPMYLVITNPTFDALYGFEFGYDIDGQGMVLNMVYANPSVIDVGSPGNHIAGFGSPSPTTPVTLLATLAILYMDTTMAPLNFFMHGTTPSSIDPQYPVVLLADGVLQSVGIFDYYGDITSTINSICYSATDEISLEGIKSLYR